MAESYGFFDGDNLYGQDEFNRYFANMFDDGISIDNNGNVEMKCYSSNNNIVIEKGFAIVKGFFLYNDSNKSIAITRDSNYIRKDRIVIRLDFGAKKVSIQHKIGVAGSSPTPPNLQRDNIIHELSLCQIHVPTTGNISITDERFREDLCGTIRPKFNTQYKDMINQFSKQFDTWFDNVQGKGWRNIYIQSNKPQDSVAGAIWIKELT